LGSESYGDAGGRSRLIRSLFGKGVVGVASGWGTSFVWTQTGDMYAFGDGRGTGKLGMKGSSVECGKTCVPRQVKLEL